MQARNRNGKVQDDIFVRIIQSKEPIFITFTCRSDADFGYDI